MEIQEHELQLRLIGPFRLGSRDGNEIRLRSAKSRGLLALLAVAPDGRRSRAWLQDKLWSDRGREQASASLRQALSQIRTELKEFAGFLDADREAVTLDLSRIKVVTESNGDARSEFLEGIDLRDPEFEAWLRTERSARWRDADLGQPADPAAPALRGNNTLPPIHLVAESTARSSERLVEDILLDCLDRSLSDSLAADVFRGPPPASAADPIVVSAQAFVSGPRRFGIRLSIEQGPARRAIWSALRSVESAGAPPVDREEILSLVHEATDALADALLMRRQRSRAALEPALLGRLAIRKLFLMQPQETLEADGLLTAAFAADPHPIFLAWKIELRVIQRMERHQPTLVRIEEEIAELTEQAFRLDPGHPMVLAAAANAKLLVDGDANAGVELARASLRMGPANPFAWDCLSIALLSSGALEEAHRHQMTANAIAARSPIRHFWDMGACLTSVVTGRHEQAQRLAQSASAISPAFRPPLRYLTALAGATGDERRARDYADRLQRIEPDFTIDRLLRDDTYPVAAMRRSGLLANEKLRALVTS